MGLFLTDLASVLRRAGLAVVEVDGWQTRHYPRWNGFDRTPTHVMVHHTASNTTPANDVAYMIRGAPNPGGPNLAPIGNLYLSRGGVFHVIAAGPATTNGKGSSRPWNGGVPDDAMNHYAIAIEAANAGTGEPWPAVQTTAYVAGVAALCNAYGIPTAHVRGHAEWAPGRKIDPAGPSPWATGAHTWNMDAFRRDVDRARAPRPVPPPAPAGPPFVTIGDDTVNVLTPPVRILDTRNPARRFRAGETRQIDLGARANGARAVMVNLTAVPAGQAGYLSAWSTGPKPVASAVNYSAAGSIANALIVPVANRKISIAAFSAVDVVVDLLAVWT